MRYAEWVFALVVRTPFGLLDLFERCIGDSIWLNCRYIVASIFPSSKAVKILLPTGKYAIKIQEGTLVHYHYCTGGHLQRHCFPTLSFP